MPSPDSTSSPLSSTVNLINNIIGAGLFSMPWCLLEATVLTGVLMFLLICVLNIISFALLARCCTLTGRYSYLDMGELALGPRCGAAAQATAMLYACGSLISYVVLAGNFLLGKGTGLLVLAYPDAFADAGVGDRVAVGFAFAAVGFLPLSLLRRLDSLKLSSWAALFATLYAGYITLYQLAASPAGSLTPDEAARGHASLRASVHYAGLPLSLWAAVPIVNVAFTAHYNAPRYYAELERRSVSRYVGVASAALLVALVVYLAVGVSGYLAFGDLTAGDVLENFANAYPLAVGARAALLVVLLSCFPKVQHAVRDGLIRLFFTPHTTDSLPFGTLVMLTLLVVSSTTLIGTLIQEVDVVLAYKGAIFGSLMVYVWPALMHTALVLQLNPTAATRPHTHVQSTPPSDVPSAGHPTAPLQSGGGGTLHAQLLPAGHVVASESGGDELAARADGPPPLPVPLGRVLGAMATQREHALPALLLVWGVVSGILGVVVTIDRQVRAADALHNATGTA